MKIHTTMLEDEIFEAVNDNHIKVRIDMRKREVKENQSPPELLLSALSGCGAVDMVMMLKKRRKTIQRFDIVTDGTRQEKTPHYFTAIHCHFVITSPDVEEEELKKIAGLSLEKYCTVASSLRSKVTYSVEVIRP